MNISEEKLKQIKDYYKKTVLDPEVCHATVGVAADHINHELLLATTKKLVKINRNEAEPDDRDNLKFNSYHTIEDFVAEHIEKDAGKLQAKAKMKMDQKKNLSWLHSGYFSPQIRSVTIGNELSQNIEGVNPMEFVDISHKCGKTGEGGISSDMAIPDISRQVSMSHFGITDTLKITENLSVGSQLFLAHGIRKGQDRKLYREVLDKNKKPVWISHVKYLDSNIELPKH